MCLTEVIIVGYKEGSEHHLFFSILAGSIPKGAEFLTEDTETRLKWYEENSHLLPRVMLLATFAYVEGIIGSTWIEDYGNDFNEELEALRMIRNAMTHHNGYVKMNRYARGRNGEQQFVYVKRFSEKLKNNEYEPLKKWEKEKRMEYIQVELDGVVNLGKSAFGRLGALGQNIFVRAKK